MHAPYQTLDITAAVAAAAEAGDGSVMLAAEGMGIHGVGSGHSWGTVGGVMI